jgi:hypothetical protein
MILMVCHCKEQRLPHCALLLSVLLHEMDAYDESKADTQPLRQDCHSLGPFLYFLTCSDRLYALILYYQEHERKVSGIIHYEFFISSGNLVLTLSI